MKKAVAIIAIPAFTVLSAWFVLTAFLSLDGPPHAYSTSQVLASWFSVLCFLGCAGFNAALFRHVKRDSSLLVLEKHTFDSRAPWINYFMGFVGVNVLFLILLVPVAAYLDR